MTCVYACRVITRPSGAYPAGNVEFTVTGPGGG